MSEPRYQHSADELRHVASILDALNCDVDASVCRDIRTRGSVEFWWADTIQGTIEYGGVGDQWCYYPVARGEKPEKETDA